MPTSHKSTSTGNPFAEFSEDELILAYVNFSHMNDVEAIDLVFEVYDMYTYLDSNSIRNINARLRIIFNSLKSIYNVLSV